VHADEVVADPTRAVDEEAPWDGRDVQACVIWRDERGNLLSADLELVSQPSQTSCRASCTGRSKAGATSRRTGGQSRHGRRKRSRSSTGWLAVKAFVADEVDIKPGGETLASDLYAAWCAWCATNGRKEPGSSATFGRDLRAALPTLKTSQRGKRDEPRPRMYQGIALKRPIPPVQSRRLWSDREDP
jgi:hypothetical protein